MGQLGENILVTVTLSGPAPEVMAWLGKEASEILKGGMPIVSQQSFFQGIAQPATSTPPVESFPAPEAVPTPPVRGRRKAAAGQNEPVTQPVVPQPATPGAGPGVAEAFPFEDPKPGKIKASDMLDFSQIPEGAEVYADFRFHTQPQFMSVVRDIVKHIPDRAAAQQVVTDNGFKSIADVPQDKYSDVIAGLLRLMYAKAGKTVHVETPTADALI